MNNIHEIKLRMHGILETRQITSSMKLISAAKMKKARRQLEQTLPFFRRVSVTTADILLRSSSLRSRYIEGSRRTAAGTVNQTSPKGPAGSASQAKQTSQTCPAERKGYLVITGDKGLAGAYNHMVQKTAEEAIAAEVASSGTAPLLFAVGRNGHYYFERKGYNLFEGFEFPVQDPTVYRAREIAEILLEQYNSGRLCEVYMIFTMVRSAFKIEPHIVKLLPLNLEMLSREAGVGTGSAAGKDAGPDMGVFAEAGAATGTGAGAGTRTGTGTGTGTSTGTGTGELDICYEPSPEAVFDLMIPKYIKGVIYGALVESFTCEQQSRMMAMENATAKADEMIARLQLEYNRARQAAITQEISEIIGGAEVLLKQN